MTFFQNTSLLKNVQDKVYKIKAGDKATKIHEILNCINFSLDKTN